MKKISLGSFPLISIHGKDRKNFESYMIKVLSDLITANQLSNSINSDRVQYITPLSIMNFIKANKDKNLAATSVQPGASTQSDDREHKARTIKHAFKNTKTRNLFGLFFSIYKKLLFINYYRYMDFPKKVR